MVDICNNASLITQPNFYFQKLAVVEISITNLTELLFIETPSILFVQLIGILLVSGTFSVPLDIVGSAAFSALMMFDSYTSQLSPKKRHLDVINFVNIDKSVTESLITVFTMHLRDSSQHIPPADDVEPKSPFDTKVTSDDDSLSEPKVSKIFSPRNACCVCGKTESGRNKFVDKESCSHRCCSKCKSQPCNKCRSLPHAVSHTRKIAEPQISSKDVDYREQNNAGARAVDTNCVAASLSQTFRSRSNSFRDCSSRSSSRTIAAATGKASKKTDPSNSKPENSHQTEDEFTPRRLCRRSTSLTRDDRERYSEKRNAENCVICMDKMTNPKKLDCGHTFCAECIEAAFAHAAKCPCCGRIFGKLKGNQPTGGTMKIQRSRDDLAGYRGAGSILIVYEIPSGFQQVCCELYGLFIKVFDQVPRDILWQDIMYSILPLLLRAMQGMY